MSVDDQPSAPGSEYSSESSSSSDEDEIAAHYATAETENKGPIKSFFSKFSPSGLGERMLRKTIRHNTWIYVNSLDGNLFIGLKKTGSFQHSSFLSGGRVTSAGIITASPACLPSRLRVGVRILTDCFFFLFCRFKMVLSAPSVRYRDTTAPTSTFVLLLSLSTLAWASSS